MHHYIQIANTRRVSAWKTHDWQFNVLRNGRKSNSIEWRNLTVTRWLTCQFTVTGCTQHATELSVQD